MYELQRLNARHQHIIRLILLGQYNQAQIGRMTGFDPVSISYIINSPIFQEEVARRRSELQAIENNEIVNNLALAKTHIDNSSLGAVKKLDELVHESPDQNIQLRASEAILKLAFGDKNNHGTTQIGQVIVIDGGKLEFLRKVRVEAGLDNGTRAVDSRLVEADTTHVGRADEAAA